MKIFHEELRQSNIFGEILHRIENKKAIKIGIEGPSESQKAHCVHMLLCESGKKCVYVCPNDFTAQKMYEDFRSLTGNRAVYLPVQEYFLYDVEAKSHELQYERLGVLQKILAGDYEIIVVSAEILAQRLPQKDKFKNAKIFLEVNESAEIDTLVKKFLQIGYERYELVQGRGQFAVRGGILDIFPVNSANPIRIDFFGDDIDSVRIFDIVTQRSIEEINGIEIPPAREIFFKNEEERLNVLSRIKAASGDNAGVMIKNDLERFEASSYFPGIDRYTTIILDDYDTLLDYLPFEKCEVLFIADEPDRIYENFELKETDFAEQCKNMLEKGYILPDLANLYDAHHKFLKKTEEISSVYLKTLGSFKTSGVSKTNTFTLPARSISGFGENLRILVDQIKEWEKLNNKITILAGNKGRCDRLKEMLEEQGISFNKLKFEIGSLNKSFEYMELKLIVISDNELFTTGVQRSKRKGKKGKGKPINSFTDLVQGDYIVHDLHGIGQYMGLEQVTVMGVTRDYIKIKYKDGGFLYVPTNQMNLVQKYIGAEGHAPKVSKLGSGDWERAKKKVKESLKQLAEELVRLYASRQASKGYAFSQDTVWQKEFEEAFPFEETDDQLQCTEELKHDMESERPMERLLCGDVGYGKTEVALRAVFKAVMDSKQVAFLVPTTVLAQQHYKNFVKRFEDFPIKVDYICRFRTPAEQRNIIKKVKRGEIDVLVGTHRLIQKDIEFKDLGLLVVDEEQRFGVAHKERIKEAQPNVDILTLSATPIPRTLHMSMVQIRDISIIEEPPEERHPVQTYVIEYEPPVIREAVYKELARGGQVFYLYNKVKTIKVKAVELSHLIPEAKIGVAHGQMSENELEQVMMDFMEGNYDVLVCTTIIESGLDISNVNTIIVEDGDHLGLAQLYQLRGRVGRSSRIAYAYITYKKDKVLTEVSEKRLQTIKEFTEFGSGFKIAMRDLEIRGAGNLLGEQQHGQMESVGYDMYVKLLDRAVREIKDGHTESAEDDIAIDISITAYIDEKYIFQEEDRLEMYKKISLISSNEDIMDVRDELIDRFGDIPDEVENLIMVAGVKALAKRAGFKSISETKDLVVIKFLKNIFSSEEFQNITPEKIADVMDKFNRKLLFNAGSEPYLAYRKGESKGEKLLLEVENVLKYFIN